MQFIGVAALDTEESMQNFVANTGIDGVFPNINDGDGDVWAAYGITSQPAFVFLSADGTTETTGGLGEDALNDRINSIFG